MRRYAEMFDQLRAAALNPVDARRMVTRLADEGSVALSVGKIEAGF